MALVMRSVGGGCRAMAAAPIRVVCGTEPTTTTTTRMARLSQPEFPRRDGAVQRCQVMQVEARESTGGAAVMMDESSSIASFEASYRSSDAAARVYHGRRGGGDWYPATATPTVLQESTDLEVPMMMMGKGEVIASLEASLQDAGRNAGTIASLAVRAWRKLGDADRAEELYLRALELAPQDSSIQASYAEFLWQCDA